MCQCVTNSWNSVPVKGKPLPMTMSSGNPWIANTSFIFLAVLCEEVAVETGKASSHFERTLMMIKYMCPTNEPALSACSLTHCSSGHFHDSLVLLEHYSDYIDTSYNFSLLVLVAHSFLATHLFLAKVFIFIIPGWVSYKTSITFSLPTLGIITLLPHRMQPSTALNSLRLSKCGTKSESLGFPFDHPLKGARRTCARGAVHNLISAAELGEQNSSFNRSTVSAGIGTFDRLSNSGSWLTTSTLAYYLPGG